MKRSISTSYLPPDSKKKRFFIPSPQPIVNGVRGIDTDCSEFSINMNNGLDEIKTLMKENGFVIVQNVLSDNECREMIEGMWSSLSKITNYRFSIEKPNTWNYLKELKPFRNIYVTNGIVHANFIWNLRQNTNVLKIFSTIYDCKIEDLLVSFDGASVHMPSGKGNNGNSSRSWYHVDKSFEKKKQKIQCYQSWITGLDVNDEDYTIGFFRGSHHSFDEFGTKFGINNQNNFYKLKTKEEMKFYEDKHDQIRIKCPAGSLVLWDSRVLHSGLVPMKDRKVPNFRAITFLSYGRRCDTNKRTLNRRREIFEKRRATTHWASVDVKMVPEDKNIDVLISKLNDNVNETRLMRSLIGYC